MLVVEVVQKAYRIALEGTWGLGGTWSAIIIDMLPSTKYKCSVA